MSAIFGCISLKRQPLPPGVGAAMGQAMQLWGEVALAGTEDGVLGFANRAITPESVHETLPCPDAGNGILITAAARLDNREELCDLFGIPLAERATLGDGRLVVLAHQRWGEAAPEHLFGDWSYAAWAEGRRRLFLARDPMGNTGLFFHISESLVAFASDPEALFAVPGIRRRINEAKLAGYLAMASVPEPDATQWLGVRELLPGQALVITPEAETLSQHWRMEEVAPLQPRSDEAWLEGFLDLYRRAVQVRLRSRLPIGTSLSAGLDSGSVTVLAAELLAQEGKPLTAFTAIPLSPAKGPQRGRLVDEWPLAHRVALRYPNIEHLPLCAEHPGPVAGIRTALELVHAPMHAAPNLFWIMALHQQARDRGLGVMLTGQLGNGGVSWSGGRDRIFQLLASGHWDEGRRALAQWRTSHGHSWIQALLTHLLKPLLRPYRQRIPGLARSAQQASAILPAFAARMGVAGARWQRELSGLLPPTEERRLTLVRNAKTAGPLWHRFGAAFAMEVRDPTADIRLLEFCLGAPVEQFTHGGGERMLLRRALEGRLPPEVQWNRLRGRQAADLIPRLLRHPQEVEAALARFASQPLIGTYLDPGELRRAWERILGGSRDLDGHAVLLLRGIMCGLFLEDAHRLGAS